MNFIKSLATFLALVVCTNALEDATSYFASVDSAAYLDWLSLTGGAYGASAYLPSPSTMENGVAIHWTLNDDHIELAVAARATGWLGLGIGEVRAFHRIYLVK